MPRLAIAQLRPTKGDYGANLQKIGGVLAQIAKLDPPVDLVVFPETATSGYFVEGGGRPPGGRCHRVLRSVPEPLLQLVSLRLARRQGRGRAARAQEGVSPHLR